MQVKFYPKETSAKLPSTLFARITYNYNSLKLYTDLKILPEKWDHKNQRAKNSLIGSPEFNHSLTIYKERIQQSFNRFKNENNNQEPDKETLKKLLFIEFKKELPRAMAYEESLKTFWGYFQHFINQSIDGIRKSKQGTVISKNTIDNYKTLKSVLKEFEQFKHFQITFDKIDFEFFTDFINFLEKKKSYRRNTIQTIVRTFKTLLRESLENGYHSNTKFTSSKFSAPSENVTTQYLNEHELDELSQLDLSNNSRLEKVRDIFLVSCYTGLRFSDLQQVTIKNIITDHLYPSDKYLTIKQVKTGDPVTIPVDKRLMLILEKYDFILPSPISNQKTNQFLKEICQKLTCLNQNTEIEFTKGGLKVTKVYPKYELISTHTARRSFATNAYLSGQQPRNIMAVTGHKSETSFYKYIRVTPMEMARLFKQHVEKHI